MEILSIQHSSGNGSPTKKVSNRHTTYVGEDATALPSAMAFKDNETIGTKRTRKALERNWIKWSCNIEALNEKVQKLSINIDYINLRLEVLEEGFIEKYNKKQKGIIIEEACKAVYRL